MKRTCPMCGRTFSSDSYRARCYKCGTDFNFPTYSTGPDYSLPFVAGLFLFGFHPILGGALLLGTIWVAANGGHK